MTATVFVILLVFLLATRFFFTCLIVLLIGLFVFSDPPRAHADTSPYAGSINHALDADWRKAVEHAKAISAKQNHGHQDFVHSCYAEGKEAFCADTVAYKNPDKNVTLVRVIRRGLDNSMYARDICVFNKLETLRMCVDFDNGYKSYWAEKDGDMVQVYPDNDADEAASGGL